MFTTAVQQIHFSNLEVLNHAYKGSFFTVHALTVSETGLVLGKKVRFIPTEVEAMASQLLVCMLYQSATGD